MKPAQGTSVVAAARRTAAAVPAYELAAYDERAATDVPLCDRLMAAQVAALCGWQPRTVTQNVSRGRMPPPSGHFGRTPWWDRAVIVKWQEQRLGRGVGGGRPRKDTP